MDLYDFDSAFRGKGYNSIAGVDEAGRGPVAGPVVAAAVVLPEGLRLDGLNDSKKVSERNRKRLFFDILASGSQLGIGVAGVEEIESRNILGATKVAMSEALKNLSSVPALVILDAVELPGLDIPQEPVVKGDTKSACVAAASIVAKYVRDRIMLHYSKIYPQYGFGRHKGYGTREHLAAIREHGPCPIHRQGFRGVRDLGLPFED
jgi:ribonuclease HII